MDQDSTAILSVVGIVISVGGALFTVINHKRCRSNCFGKKLELSIDIDQTQPSPDKKATDEPKAIFDEKLTIKVPEVK
jgi:hypothetical protein